MNTTLNYILEANIALVFLLAFYYLFLRRETKFNLMRYYLLASVFISLTLPFIDVTGVQNASPFSIGRVIPTYWLPEVAINGEAIAEQRAATFDFWEYTTILYIAGLSLCLISVAVQLIQLFQVYRKAESYQVEGLHIAESNENKPTFSFFNFIFIGKAHELTTQEKEQIIRHESVHARQLHSLDLLLINVLKVFFWFNPFLNIYKKNFIQLHEFEADARAVENSDLNKYCSLLARVALQSADFKLANHFNNSLTVKRIEMMRTIKMNIKKWKLAALGVALPMLFFFISCQDQIMDDLTEITQNSSHALMVPAHIQKRFDQLKLENPEKQYVLLELNDKASGKLEELQEKYGLPKSMEVFKTNDGSPVGEPVRGEAEKIIIEKRKISDPGSDLADGGKIKFRRTEELKNGQQTFAIIEFNEESSKISEAAAQEEVFTVVEEQPEFPGGYEAMMAFLRSNVRYPENARMSGIEGTVYVSFIVEKDGAITSIKPIRGISPECDAEVVRVMELSPNWSPGKQKKESVRVRFVLPVKFEM